MHQNRISVRVAARGEAVGPIGKASIELPYGTPMSAVKSLVLKEFPRARVLEIENSHLQRLCRWLGSRTQQEEFNRLILYILTESSRYCPEEDMGGYGAPGFDWQNPFTA